MLAPSNWGAELPELGGTNCNKRALTGIKRAERPIVVKKDVKKYKRGAGGRNE